MDSVNMQGVINAGTAATANCVSTAGHYFPSYTYTYTNSQLSIEKVANGYLIRHQNVTYIAASQKEVAGLISKLFSEDK